jgi:acyl dehydratase
VTPERVPAVPFSYEPQYYEDLTLGKTFESAGRTITEADVGMHSAFSGDWTEVHTNAEYVEETRFGQRIAHGPLTFSVTTGLFARCGVMERAVVAFLGVDDLRFTQPVHIGDTVRATFEVTGRRDPDSRDDVGIVDFGTAVSNQDEATVLEMTMRFMFRRREA